MRFEAAVSQALDALIAGSGADCCYCVLNALLSNAMNERRKADDTGVDH